MNGSIEKISYEDVTRAASDLIASSQKMTDILETVEQRMQSVNTEETWKSAAAEQLYDKFKSLSQKFESFTTAVKGYGQFLNKTVETYRAADDAIAGKAEELLSE